MAQAHVRKGDTVIIIAGRERGKRGKVLRVFPAEGRLIVERLNMMKKHQKPTRVGVRMLTEGRKARIARKSGEIIDKA